MTDRLHSLTVILDHDIREDDAQSLIAAIGQLKWVVGVKPHVSDVVSLMAERRARIDLRSKILSILADEDY